MRPSVYESMCVTSDTNESREYFHPRVQTEVHVVNSRCNGNLPFDAANDGYNNSKLICLKMQSITFVFMFENIKSQVISYTSNIFVRLKKI